MCSSLSHVPGPSGVVVDDVQLPPFQALLDAHGRDVHRFLIAIVGPVDADDCYQETWLSALRAYPGLRDDSNLRAWVLTVAHRKAIDHLRGRARRPVAVSDPEALAGSVPGPEPGDDALWAAVAALPDKQRTAVTLRYVADCSHDQVGEVMGITPEAALRNVHEGLKRLRKDHRP